MTNSITLTPAYGRDYRSKKAVLEAWNSDIDFTLNSFGHPFDGKPVNKSQFTNDGLIGTLRYDKQRKVIVI